MRRIRVKLKDRSYDIVIGRHLLEKTGALLKRLGIGHDAIVITNGILRRLYANTLVRSLTGSGFTTRLEIVPDSEKAKSERIAATLINRIAAYDTRKNVFIIAFGGGVVGDLAGFVAALYKRGIPYVQLPTTLLAQVDSAIGGKVAIDLPVAKNMVGVFYQPKIVVSDISLLGTLPERQMRSGLAEVIKYGVIKAPSLFRFLEKNYRKVLEGDRDALEYVVWRSSLIKARLVEADELDRKNLRVILNYGHTIGHAIEAAASYSGRYNHGESIAIGMVAAARISLAMGIMPAGEADRISSLIGSCGLPTRVKGPAFSDIYKAHLHDKKFANSQNRFVLPRRIGRVRVVEGVNEDIVRKAIKTIF